VVAASTVRRVIYGRKVTHAVAAVAHGR